MAAPGPYIFNHEVYVDIFEIYDSNAVRYSFLSVVDRGTCYHAISLVRVGGSQPKSSKCWQKFMEMWVSWAGFPKIVTSDRGLHNRGHFSRGLANNGVFQRQAALESPEMIGRGERHGGIIKRVMKRMVNAFQASDKYHMKLIGAIAQLSLIHI